MTTLTLPQLFPLPSKSHRRFILSTLTAGFALAVYPIMAQTVVKTDSKGSEIHIYPDAPHAFYADYRPSYRKEAADDGWQRLQNWFKQHGVK